MSGVDGGMRSFSVAGFSRPKAEALNSVVAVIRQAADRVNRLGFIRFAGQIIRQDADASIREPDSESATP